MTDEDIIAEITRICPGAKAQNFRAYWWVALPCGQHSGTRTDPISLLRDLMDIEARSDHIEEPTRDPLSKKLADLEAAKANIDEALDAAPKQPPEAIADLIDPNLTAQQNMDALIDKYAATMSEREHELSGGNTSRAMELLRKAERLDSGIKWNRARLAEVLG